jgi:serine protease Do
VKTHLIPLVIAFTAISPLAGLTQPARDSKPTVPAAVTEIERTLEDAIARAEPSVVAISRTSPPKPPDIKLTPPGIISETRVDAAPVVGAGVIIDSAGLVLTQYLAVREGDQHSITTVDRTTYPATVRAADARSGLAVLAVDKASPQTAAAAKTTPDTFPALRFGDADALRKGQFVIAIGNPFALKNDGQPTASWGIVTNLAQKAPPGTNFNDAPGLANDYRTTLHHLGTLIQTDAKLGWSTGGGALVNLRGELIGITTTAATIAGHEQPAGYAIPINATFRRIIDRLKEGREVEYGMLGVGFAQSLMAAIGPKRVPASRLTLQQVFAGGPAARAGLQAGDVVLLVGEKPVNDVDEVQLAVSLLPPGAATTIGYERNGQDATTQLTLAKLAAAGKNIVSVQPETWRGMRIDYATALDAIALTQATASGTYSPDGCVLVTEVEESSDAWNAGVRSGMFVSHVGKKRVSTPAEFHAATCDVGKSFDIRLTRSIEAMSEPAQPAAKKPE